MLQAWIGPGWALLGGFLMALQYGIYSYWSQTYWGGMVAALGGALVFGAARRLWDRLDWRSSACLALGIVVLVNSRPFEGFLALLPISGAAIVHLSRKGLWKQSQTWIKFVLPAGVVLAAGAFLTCSYNRAITGSPWKPPYMLHEQQYQESPQFSFLPLRSKLTYSSPWVQYYYEVQEMRLYRKQRDLKFLITGFAGRIASWWEFYCGILLTVPLVIPGLLRKGPVRYVQGALLVILALLWFSDPRSPLLRGAFDLSVFAQIAVLWVVFDGFWPRLAVITSALLIVEALLVKWFFPHYFAPAACLVLYLEVEGLRRMWHWKPQEGKVLDRSQRRRLAKQTAPGSWLVPRLQNLVYLLPVICVLSLVLRVEARVHGWKEGIYDPALHTLPLDDWSLRRAELDHWLEQQGTPQLVFVRYSARHNVNFEWVYNHADIMRSHVVWARDLGAEHNRLLLQAMPDRTVWSLEADLKDPQLVPYALAPISVPAPETHAVPSEDRSDQ
jgi:hypothetical protein